MQKLAAMAVVVMCVGLLAGCGHAPRYVGAVVVDVYNAGTRAWLNGHLLGSADGELVSNQDVVSLRWVWPDGLAALRDYEVSHAAAMSLKAGDQIWLRVEWYAHDVVRVFVPWSDERVAVEHLPAGCHGLWRR